MTRPLLEREHQSTTATASAQSASVQVNNALARVFVELAHSARLAAQIEGGVRRQALEQLAHRFGRGGQAMADKMSVAREGKLTEERVAIDRTTSAPAAEAARTDKE